MELLDEILCTAEMIAEGARHLRANQQGLCTPEALAQEVFWAMETVRRAAQKAHRPPGRMVNVKRAGAETVYRDAPQQRTSVILRGVLDPQKRIWVLGILQQTPDLNLSSCDGPVSPAILFGLALSLLELSYRAILVRAKIGLRAPIAHKQNHPRNE